MRHRVLASLSVVAVVSMSASPVAAQTGPRTAWGDPDLQGVWDFRTITPLERPEDLGDQEFLSEEEAANLLDGRQYIAVTVGGVYPQLVVFVLPS